MGADPSRILLIRPSALGDVCRSVCVLVSLKSAYPEAEIDWLVQDGFADAVREHPDLDEVVPFPRKRLAGFRPGAIASFVRELRSRRYDMVVDAQGLLRSGLLALASGAPVRVGESSAREGAGLCYSRTARTSRRMHSVDRMLAIARAAGAEPVADMRLYTTAADRGAAGELVPEGSIVLAPTSRWPAKQWPARRFAELCSRLLARVDGQVAVVGGPGERDQCAPLLELAGRDPRVIDLIGATSVGRLMGVIERASLVVSNDSAAAHMAVGLETPLVAIYGPTDVSRVGPYRHGRVLQRLRPEDRLAHKDAPAIEITERVTVGEVLDACLEELR
ncbi:MAG: glycosyltransferase family 9 protein [Planctomycetota bacterium]